VHSSAQGLRSSRASRYRTEGDLSCIDVRVGKVQQLFDNRDPAPFLVRDLDPGLVDYLLDSAEDLLARPKVGVFFWLEERCAPGEIEKACRAQFAFLLERTNRRRRRRRRWGLIALALALILLAALQFVAQLVPDQIGGPLGAGLAEGAVILSWVLMWRPVELLLYDWIPVHREKRILRKLLDAPIEVRLGKGPKVPLPQQDLMQPDADESAADSTSAGEVSPKAAETPRARTRI